MGPAQEYKFRTYDTEFFGERMRLFHLTVPTNVFRFVPFCDWHWGSLTCRHAGIERLIKRVKDEQLPWASYGDLMENNIPGAAGLTTEQLFMPGHQFSALKDMLKPIAHLNIGGCDGNHEYRAKRAADMSLTKMLYESLGIGDRYFNTAWAGIITLQRRAEMKPGQPKPSQWVCWGFHGSGGGSTPGGKLNSQHKADRIIRNADLVISGHHHNMTSDISEGYTIAMNNNKGLPGFKCTPTFYQTCGAGLNYLESYAHKKNMPPSVRYQCIIEIGVKRTQRTGHSDSAGLRPEYELRYQNRELVHLV